MPEEQPPTQAQAFVSAEKTTIQKILQMGYGAFERTHPLPNYVRRAVCALLACRTAVLGGHIQACPDGHMERIWYNSCKHRFCPQCSYLQVARWLAKQKARLLACDHYHVIFTFPHELNKLWSANIEEMSRLFFAAVHDTLFELLSDGKYLGARPGIIATLQTWSQTLILHIHIHCLVTGGGLDETGRWVKIRNGFLLPMGVVMEVFRGKLREAILQGLERGKLKPPPGKSRQQMKNLLNQVCRKKWNVHLKERYSYGEGVLIYLARYLRGGPISNRRLISCDGKEVVFWYEERAKKGGQAKRRTMRLSNEQFIGRLLLHVPLPNAVRVRCWGLYSHTQGQKLALCRQQLDQGPVEAVEPLDWQSYCEERGEEHPERCPVCGQQLVCVRLVPRAGAPPPAEELWEKTA